MIGFLGMPKSFMAARFFYKKHADNFKVSFLQLLCKFQLPSDEDLLPPKLYLVVFYQVSLVNQTKMICLDFRRPSEVLVVLYHMFVTHGGIVINVLA